MQLGLMLEYTTRSGIRQWEMVIGWSIGVLLGVSLLTNGIVMVISPRKWFELPGWFASARGALRKDKYSTGFGGIQVRLMGALIIAFLVWVCLDSLRPR